MIEHDSKLGERMRENELLSKHSSLRIGGPARYWAEVHTDEELHDVLEFARAKGLPTEIVGLGSNSLFPDAGLEAIVIRLAGEFAQWQVESQDDQAIVRVGAGVVNAHLVRGLLKEGWIGMEFLALIPGTFGGAVAMNAGTRETELSQILRHVHLVVPSEPRKVSTVTPDRLHMAYRHSKLPETGSVVVGGGISVRRGDVDAASVRVKDDKDRRNRTQPYRLASVGSTFANPEGDYAGRLIDEVGLKGVRQGGARISDLHANFFINEEDASAEDFIRLMARARHEVRQAFDVELRPEVQFVGFDGWALMRQFEEELEAALEGGVDA